MSTYFQFLLLGLGNGGVFAALAMALVVTYRSSGVLNFATGAQALYAAYTYSLLRNGQLLIPIPGIGPTVSVGSNLGFWPALLITLGIQAVMGAVVYLLVFRPLRNHRPVAKAVASLGLMGLLTAIVSYQVGTQVVLVNPIFPQNHVKWLGIDISTDRLLLAGTIIGLGIVLTVLFRFTRFGLATRASAETEVGALVSGLSPDRIALVNWIISFVVCGIAGVLIAPLVPLQPGTYTLFIVPALAAAVVGRFHSLGWAITAGLGIGALESLSIYINGLHPNFPAGAGQLIPLILVLVVLAVRGQTMPSRGTLTQVTLGRAPRPHWRIATAIIGTGAGIAAIYLFTGNDRAALYSSFITGVISLSLVVVTGYTGQISLAQLTLAGVSAYILSTFTTSWGIPFPIAPILSALVAAAAGVVIGIPALRVRGLMLGVVTLTFAAGVEAIWFNNNAIDGGASGLNIPTPRLFGMDLSIGSGKDFPRPAFGILCLVVLVLVALGVSWLRTSRLGTAMLAVRSDERSAAAAGINVVRVKLIGFAIAAFIAGLGGSLLAYQLGNVTFQDFDAYLGLVIFSIVVVAGITSVSGGILAGMLSSGGLLVALISSGIGSGGVDNWYGVVAGVSVILTVIFNPDGVVGPTHVFLEQQRTKGMLARPQGALVPAVAATPTSSVPLRTREAAPVVTPDFGTNGTFPATTPASAAAAPASTSGGPLLEVRNLTVRYGGVVAVDNVSFSVQEGQIVGLIGPNGAGKTTTIDALCGFHGCEGTVVLAGKDVGGCAPHVRSAMGLARTFQLAGVSDDLTVAENVQVGQQHATGDEAETLTRILDDLGLTDMRELQVSMLSQGQRQLVSVARALAGEPRLLLLDEPAAGLDSTESLWLAERLRAVRDSGVTILLVDHDMSLVLNLCDTIDVLNFGALIAHGTPDEIRHDEVVSTAYLGATHQRLAVS
ncbi:MAG TPA: branched-chain amino acid ABC transporter permease/ATP-binding protein [Acidimicrobiales bacterium]|jgi:sulfate-transporting ATPase|nr:branched-chain amino acid ABC transporter permease/ATP-binding protein [Acidimicrobiales bacterium]